MKYLLIILIVLNLIIRGFAQDHFIVGVEELSYYPYYDNVNGEYIGFFREVLDDFAVKYGYSFEYRALPLERLYKDFADNKLDFKLPDNSKWKQDFRQQVHLIYSDPIIEFTDGIIVLEKNIEKDSSFLKTIGMMRGFTAIPYLDEIRSGDIIIYENNSLSGLLMQILLNRVDGVYINPVIVNHYLRENEIETHTLFLNHNLPYYQDYYFLSTIRYGDIIEEFNLYLQDNQDYINLLKEHYLLE